MDQFFKYAQKLSHISTADIEFLRDLRLRAQGGYAFYKGEKTNLEHILSFAFAQGRITSSDNLNGYVYGDFCRLLADCYRLLDITAIEKIRGHLQKFLTLPDHLSAADCNLTIITTNYDLVFESVAQGLFEEVHLPGAWTGMSEDKESVFTKAPSRNVFCKLHGSVNWFVNTENRILIDDRFTDVKIPLPDPPQNKFLIGAPPREWDHPPEPIVEHYRPGQRLSASLPNYVFSDDPILVPPSFLKGMQPPLLDATWAKAREDLANADSVVAIGYSFPKTDPHMHYFLAGAISENQDLDKVHLIDPNAIEIKKKMSDWAGDHLEGMIEVHPKKWHILEKTLADLIE